MKTCFKCRRELPESEFYRHPQMADGLLGKCKACTCTDVTQNRNSNIERYRAYDRQRGKTAPRRALRDRRRLEWRRCNPEESARRQREWRESHQAERARRQREWRERYPGRAAAHTAAARYARPAPERCERCGMTPLELRERYGTAGKLEKHHPDYGQQTRVEWLCKPCHCKADEARRKQESDTNERPNEPDEIDLEIPNTPAFNRQLWRDKGYDE